MKNILILLISLGLTVSFARAGCDADGVAECVKIGQEMTQDGDLTSGDDFCEKSTRGIQCIEEFIKACGEFKDDSEISELIHSVRATQDHMCNDPTVRKVITHALNALNYIHGKIIALGDKMHGLLPKMPY